MPVRRIRRDESHRFPVLWAITWRIRSAAWMLDHWALLDTAVT